MRWAAAAAAGLFIGLLFAWALLDIQSVRIAGWLGALQSAWWGPGAALVVFVALALLGAPQVVLIGAVVLAFGAGPGAVLAWTAIMASSVLGFALGRWGGASTWAAPPQGWLEKLQGLMQRRALWAAFLVRLVPTGPAILVNMAFGAAGVRLGAFALGTGLGIVPKIALIAGFGHGLSAWFSGRDAWIGWAAAAGLVLLAFGGRWLAGRFRSLRASAAK